MLKRFIADERGATAIEYGLLAAMLAVGLIAVLTSLGMKMSSEYAEISATIQ